MIQGWWGGQRHLVQTGQRVALAGLIIFAAGFAFFELVIGISGFGGGLGGMLVPLLLIGAGLYLLLVRNRRASDWERDQEYRETPPEGR